MALSHLLRAVASRHPRDLEAPTDHRPASVTQQHRHPAMIGLRVSPVHGHHCICDRCAPEARARLRGER